ncbi:hypothetical protein BC826DRAFT_973802 [Russula brevipes]|nr:hypothetical protein BC826DRAFT_973802 [Russula brevipes]
MNRPDDQWTDGKPQPTSMTNHITFALAPSQSLDVTGPPLDTFGLRFQIPLVFNLLLRLSALVNTYAYLTIASGSEKLTLECAESPSKDVQEEAKEAKESYVDEQAENLLLLLKRRLEKVEITMSELKDFTTTSLKKFGDDIEESYSFLHYTFDKFQDQSLSLIQERQSTLEQRTNERLKSIEEVLVRMLQSESPSPHPEGVEATPAPEQPDVASNSSPRTLVGDVLDVLGASLQGVAGKSLAVHNINPPADDTLRGSHGKLLARTKHLLRDCGMHQIVALLVFSIVFYNLRGDHITGYYLSALDWVDGSGGELKRVETEMKRGDWQTKEGKSELSLPALGFGSIERNVGLDAVTVSPWLALHLDSTVRGPAASESTAVLASARSRPLGPSGTSKTPYAGSAPSAVGRQSRSPSFVCFVCRLGVGRVACSLATSNVLPLDNGARLGPRVAACAFPSVKIDLPHLKSAAFGLRINAVWCPSNWAPRTQAGGFGRLPMRGSRVHLALGCVHQRLVLWPGRAACSLVSGRLRWLPCLCASSARSCGAGSRGYTALLGGNTLCGGGSKLAIFGMAHVGNDAWATGSVLDGMARGQREDLRPPRLSRFRRQPQPPPPPLRLTSPPKYPSSLLSTRLQDARLLPDSGRLAGPPAGLAPRGRAARLRVDARYLSMNIRVQGPRVAPTRARLCPCDQSSPKQSVPKLLNASPAFAPAQERMPRVPPTPHVPQDQKSSTNPIRLPPLPPLKIPPPASPPPATLANAKLPTDSKVSRHHHRPPSKAPPPPSTPPPSPALHVQDPESRTHHALLPL